MGHFPTHRGGEIYPIDESRRAIPPYAVDSINIDVRTFALDTARADERIIGTGNFMWCIPAAPVDLTPSFSVRFQTPRNAQIPWGVGQFIRGIPFTEFYLTNSAQAGKTITLMWGKYVAGLLDLQNPSQVSTSVTLAKAGTLTDSADVVCATAATTLIAAAAATRRSIIVTSIAANTGNIRVKGVNDANLRGTELQPGQSAILDVTGAVYVRQTTGVNQTVSVLEILD